MSSHFNYEIDERNLRIKLRDMQLPYKEDAWVQFENYSALNHVANKSNSLPSFHLNINRTLVLPFVFGGVIILFSLLLFNFISIKDKKVQPTNELANTVIQKMGTEKQNKKTPSGTVTKEIKADSISMQKEVANPTPTIEIIKPNTVTATPSVVSVPIPINTEAGTWTTIEAGKIYSTPNIASQVIGNSNNNQTYKAIEETVYFIKVVISNNETGYIRKNSVRKNDGSSSQNQIVPQTPKERKRKKRSVETLESIQAPVNLSGGEKEPDLR